MKQEELNQESLAQAETEAEAQVPPGAPQAEAAAGAAAGAADAEALRAEVALLQAELEARTAELEASRTEARENFERWARSQADFENFRRRSRQEREEMTRYAAEGLMKDLLPVLDNLERALDADAAAESWKQGVEMTVRQLLSVLQSHGLNAIEAQGQPFDPNVHEAVMQVDSDEHEEGTVVGEVRRGYRLGDKVIRPSMVQVSRRG